MTFQDYLDIFRNRRIGAMLTLGFASGLPLALTSGTLQAWMTVEGLDIKTIGFFSLVGQAYIFKFLWAPLMDRFTPPLLGRRRGWLLVTQLGLVLGIAAMAFCPPHQALWALAALATLVAFLSASQDIVFDAYSTDVLRPAERGVGAAVKVLGYRLAMLVSHRQHQQFVRHWRENHEIGKARHEALSGSFAAIRPRHRHRGNQPHQLAKFALERDA